MSNELTLGNVIASARKKLKISQKQLASKIIKEEGEGTISVPYINDIECGRKSPSSDYLISQIAKVLSLNPDYLFYLNGRFPAKERQSKMSPEKFQKAMIAFRKSEKS